MSGGERQGLIQGDGLWQTRMKIPQQPEEKQQTSTRLRLRERTGELERLESFCKAARLRKISLTAHSWGNVWKNVDHRPFSFVRSSCGLSSCLKNNFFPHYLFYIMTIWLMFHCESNMQTSPGITVHVPAALLFHWAAVNYIQSTHNVFRL